MENLKKLRIEKKMTQLVLQMKTGIDQAMISKYESDERVPTVQILCLFADFFNTSLDYLADRTDVREPYKKKMK